MSSKKLSSESMGIRNLKFGAGLLQHIMKPVEFGRMVKFGIVGGSSIGLYEGMLYLLTEKLGLLYIVSAIVSWVVTILYMFLLHEYWTFKDRRNRGASNILKKVLKFCAVRLVGMGIHLMVLTGMTELFGMYYLLSALLAIAVVMIWNYIASFSLVWKRQSKTGAPGLQ
jgi:dolichol-phosphate mannosyltransferase